MTAVRSACSSGCPVPRSVAIESAPTSSAARSGCSVGTGKAVTPLEVSAATSRSYASLARVGPSAADEPLELGHVVGAELVDAPGAEKAHRAGDLARQDLDGAVDAGTSPGHQTVEVGAA